MSSRKQAIVIARAACASLVLALASSSISSGQQPRAATTADVLPFKATELVLGNGLKVIVVPTGFPNLVSVQIPVQTGSRNEVEPGKSGFAHFFEHLMFRGTPTTPPEQVPRDHGEGGRARQREHERRLHALLLDVRQGAPGADHCHSTPTCSSTWRTPRRTSRPRRGRFSASTTRTAPTRSRSCSRAAA